LDAEAPSAAPVAIALVMGVSGAGKSTIGACLAKRLGWRFEDADWFHPPENIEKMRGGHALSEADRAAWLQAVAARIEVLRNNGECVVVACSALRRAHRAALIGRRADARLVYLKGGPELVRPRLAARENHFMPASLLQSQYDTLEEPAAAENPVVVASAAPPCVIVDEIVMKLGVRDVIPDNAKR
jgi:carbohydrate kinase (thermoresistant glucokinase family)